MTPGGVTTNHKSPPDCSVPEALSQSYLVFAYRPALFNRVAFMLIRVSVSSVRAARCASALSAVH